jgi:hypothetical protein
VASPRAPASAATPPRCGGGGGGRPMVCWCSPTSPWESRWRQLAARARTERTPMTQALPMPLVGRW